MSKLVDDVLFANPLRQDDFVDDFQEVDTAGRWTSVAGDSGASAALASDGTSSVVLTTGATDNNEAYITSKRTWDVVAKAPITIDFKTKYTEANTDDANVIMGLLSGAGANALVDNGAGPAASYSGAVFYKVDGGSRWNVQTSVGSTKTTTQTSIPAGGTGLQNFRIEIRPISASQAEVVFLHGNKGGNWFTQCTDTEGRLIKHYIDYSSFAAANLVVGVKAGGASSEIVTCDYARVSQVKP